MAGGRVLLDYLGAGISGALIVAAGSLLVVNGLAMADFLSWADVRSCHNISLMS